MSWEFVTYNTINDLVNSKEEAREIKYNQLMYLERLLSTSSYNDARENKYLQMQRRLI